MEEKQPVKTLEHEMAEKAKTTLKDLKQQRALALEKKKQPQPKEPKPAPQQDINTDAKKE